MLICLFFFFNQSGPHWLSFGGLSLTPLSKSHHPLLPAILCLALPHRWVPGDSFGAVLGAWAAEEASGALPGAGSASGFLQVPSARCAGLLKQAGLPQPLGGLLGGLGAGRGSCPSLLRPVAGGGSPGAGLRAAGLSGPRGRGRAERAASWCSPDVSLAAASRPAPQPHSCSLPVLVSQSSGLLSPPWKKM